MLDWLKFVFQIIRDSLMNMQGTFWALVPPLVAILLALITKEAYSSLFVGVLIGAIFVVGFPTLSEGVGTFLAKTLDTVVNDGLIAAIEGTAGIFLFLILLGILVALINKSGGSAAFGRWAEKNIKTKVGASLATFVLGVLIFVDDYFNCLTVGSVMRPISDRQKVSRAKLAYLIDATAAPVCMIAPVSSWAAAVSSVAEDAGTGISGIQLFMKAIPYNYYSLLTFVFIIGIILMKFDYGPMKRHEKLAELTGKLGAQDEGKDITFNPKGKMIDLVLPVVVLIITCVIGMIYIGGFFGVDAWGGTDCAWDFVNAFANTDSTIGLPWGALVALLFTMIYLCARRVITFKEAMECIPRGFFAMVPPILILTLAVSLKTMTSTLGAADFVHDLMQNAAGGLHLFLPAIIFLVACLLAFATGTSWGTFGILIPIVTAIFPADSTLFIIGISACLAGAVCGDHCSPISDTTIMASAGAQVEHVKHVSTQLPYAITVAIISFVTYILAGLIQNAVISLLIGIILTIATLFVLKLTLGKDKPLDKNDPDSVLEHAEQEA
ncbi:MAG: Na+/H+ antiporter NhaC family protein [Lachnospiraceae bacterium]|nr:Na+/H+ antiporter NhaC family protein [Lachnospiraceae bacterium]